MVNGAETATSDGVVSFLFNWTTYEPGFTFGGPDALISPCVSANMETGKSTCTSPLALAAEEDRAPLRYAPDDAGSVIDRVDG